MLLMEKVKLKLIKQVPPCLISSRLDVFSSQSIVFGSSSLSKCGGINLYITGVTILESMVELISPPINTIANGAINGFGFNAIGSKPKMAVIEVNTTGRKRVSPAKLMASSMLCPSIRS